MGGGACLCNFETHVIVHNIHRVLIAFIQHEIHKAIAWS